MKKIMNVEVEFIRLEAADVMTASTGFSDGTISDPSGIGTQGRYNFDNGSYQGETFDNDYDYSSHYE